MSGVNTSESWRARKRSGLTGGGLSARNKHMPSECPMAPVLEREKIVYRDVPRAVIAAETGVRTRG